MKSLDVCIVLSIAYRFIFFLAGWIAGAQGKLNQVTFVDDRYLGTCGGLTRSVVALMPVAPFFFFCSSWSQFRNLPVGQVEVDLVRVGEMALARLKLEIADLMARAEAADSTTKLPQSPTDC